MQSKTTTTYDAYDLRLIEEADTEGMIDRRCDFQAQHLEVIRSNIEGAA